LQDEPCDHLGSDVCMRQRQMSEPSYYCPAGLACSVALSQLSFSRADNAGGQLHTGVLSAPASHPPAPHVAGRPSAPPTVQYYLSTPDLHRPDLCSCIHHTPMGSSRMPLAFAEITEIDFSLSSTSFTRLSLMPVQRICPASLPFSDWHVVTLSVPGHPGVGHLPKQSSSVS
jgi:hypothetical protein